MSITYTLKENQLTKPFSYYAVPNVKANLDLNDMAERIHAANSVITIEQARMVIETFFAETRKELLAGNGITLPGLISFKPNLTGRLDSPEDNANIDNLEITANLSVGHWGR